MRILAILLLLVVAVRCVPYTLNLLNQSNGEACLDGSAPGYYFQPGSGSDIDKFIIYFMGGVYCQGTTEEEVIQQCIIRSNTTLGSSRNWAPELNSFDGIMGTDPNSTYFANWNHIIVMYCDGSFHQGYRKSPIQYGPKNETSLYFRGSVNTQSILRQLLEVRGMNKASQVVMTGGSAGGVASFLWGDYLKRLLGNNTKYWVISDSGYGINVVNLQSKTFLVQQQYKALWEVANQDIPMPNSECVKAYPSQNYLCFFGQYNTLYIESPLYISQSEYDAWMVPNILGVNCINHQLSLANCTTEEFQEIQTFRQQFLMSLQKSVSQRPGRGAWAIACSMHVFTEGAYNLPIFEVPMNSGNTLNSAVTRWILGQSPFSSLDTVSWPNNSNCAYLPIPDSIA